MLDKLFSPTPLFVLYDADGVNDEPVYGVFSSKEEAIKAREELVEIFIAECLKEDPVESGIYTEDDMQWLRADCEASLGIQELSLGINKLHY